jgi:hypothetical protein
MRATGRGPGADWNRDILEPSIEHGVESGMTREAATRGALNQTQKMFALQRLEETGSKIAQFERRAATAELAAQAVSGIRTVLKLAGLASTVYGAYNEMEKTLKVSGDYAAGFSAFVLGLAAGDIDDAIAATGVGAPLVWEAWQQHQSGPVQYMAGQLARWSAQHYLSEYLP